MGCLLDKLVEDAEHVVGVEPSEMLIAPTAVEGQMDFFNTGATSIAVRLRQNKGNIGKGVVAIGGPYTFLLLAGKTYTVNGVVPGAVVAVSSAAGGKLSTVILYR